jgi:hypothetical protein
MPTALAKGGIFKKLDAVVPTRSDAAYIQVAVIAAMAAAKIVLFKRTLLKNYSQNP